MDICVFGAGSLGSLVGGLLADEHDVTLVGRQPHVDAVTTDGLRIVGALDRTRSVAARTDAPEQADLAVVTVKSFDTETAARDLGHVSLDGALSLQNGMGNEELLASHLDCPVLAGTCTYGARLLEPGIVECTGTGTIVLGPHEGGTSSFADRAGEAFAETDIETEVSEEMPRKRWEKLAVNAGINAATALARVPNGALVGGPAEPVARNAALETARVGRRQGITLDDEELVDTTLAVADATARNTSSMLQDVRAGKRTEIDAINGFVVDQADEPVPVNETLACLVRAWEESHEPGGRERTRRDRSRPVRR